MRSLRGVLRVAHVAPFSLGSRFRPSYPPPRVSSRPYGFASSAERPQSARRTARPPRRPAARPSAAARPSDRPPGWLPAERWLLPTRWLPLSFPSLFSLSFPFSTIVIIFLISLFHSNFFPIFIVLVTTFFNFLVMCPHSLYFSFLIPQLFPSAIRALFQHRTCFQSNPSE